MSRKKIFDGKLLKLFISYLRLPNGRKAYIEEIKHPGASVVIPFAGKRIVFLRQYRAVIKKYIWELPAGTLKSGETPYACAKREVAEETGYAVRKLKRIGRIYPSPGYSDEIIYVFKADCVSRDPHKREADEMIKVTCLGKRDVLRLFRNGKISDSKTIAALAFAGII